MPVCRFCQKVQPTAEISRGRCKDTARCLERQNAALSERTDPAARGIATPSAVSGTARSESAPSKRGPVGDLAVTGAGLHLPSEPVQLPRDPSPNAPPEAA